jgi:hypothetical protein
MINRSAVETPEQKKFFTPARVREFIAHIQKVHGCTEAEAVEVAQLNYEVHGLPAGSKERNDKFMEQIAAGEKMYDRLNPWKKQPARGSLLNPPQPPPRSIEPSAVGPTAG